MEHCDPIDKVLAERKFFGSKYALREMRVGGSSLFFYHPGDTFGVKYIPTKNCFDPFAKPLFDAEREARLGMFIESLKNPHLLGITDVEKLEGGIALKVRYGGITLKNAEIDITDHNLYYTILHDVCTGLVILHQNNIVHNDISPRNITVLDGRAALIDFGESRRLGVDIDFPGVDHAFCAPELKMSGAGTYASDVYSVGKVAEVLLSHYGCGRISNADNIFGDVLDDVLENTRHYNPRLRPTAKNLSMILNDFILLELNSQDNLKVA